MRILVANTIQSIGANSDIATIVDRICSALSHKGYQVDRFTLPFVCDIPTLLEQSMSYRLLDVTESADRFIAINFPASLLRHPNKAIVLSSDFDVFPDHLAKASLAPAQLSVLRHVRRAIQVSLTEAKAIFFENRETLEVLAQRGLNLNCPLVFLNKMLNDEELAGDLASAVHKISSIRMSGPWEEQST